MKKLIKQLLKFGFVGGTAFLIDYGIMIALTEVCAFNYLFSSFVSFTVAVIYNYVLSVKWVFDVGDKRNKITELVTFMVLSIIGLGINQFLMWLGVEVLGIFYMITKIGATAVVMIYNFITRKLILEKK